MVLPGANPTKSYWIEAAKSALRDLRSTEKLPETADVVIIGGGYTGAATAYWLDRYTRGHAKQPSMVLLDARDICGGATGRNGESSLFSCRGRAAAGDAYGISQAASCARTRILATRHGNNGSGPTGPWS